ncbi:hypothetical protein DBT_1881 [Dissulfuribacter thermophilus]|uniref:Uncharacterized protein n=1 Tax=Dissulfuribacter thermophilus TaxID=1156395 RepID=A0A1B9F4Z9_9BACT|nr:hypothetical protein DBT_1881 [Dissulfuribacter thermophilus]
MKREKLMANIPAYLQSTQRSPATGSIFKHPSYSYILNRFVGLTFEDFNRYNVYFYVF